jgi:hypothetical protein
MNQPARNWDSAVARLREREALRDLDELATYEGTPFLSAVANLCSAVGTFIGVYAAIFLLGYLHKGFAQYWPMALILAVDLAVNLAVRIALFRRRRAHGLTLAERRQRLGYKARPAR